jgi:signal transduction histidine kinase
VYYVRDNGLGIPEPHQAKIFQAFQRAHPGVGAGEGIGLAIVARVAERHRGKVWVESRAGEGSTFYLALRTEPDRAADPARRSGAIPWPRATS